MNCGNSWWFPVIFYDDHIVFRVGIIPTKAFRISLLLFCVIENMGDVEYCLLAYLFLQEKRVIDVYWVVNKNINF